VLVIAEQNAQGAQDISIGRGEHKIKVVGRYASGSAWVRLESDATMKAI